MASSEIEINAKQEEILAELSALAPNNEVRDCIRLYKVGNSTKALKAEFNKCTKETLVDTLSYLQVNNQELYTKPTCVNNLVCRIQNLFPDTCDICREQYQIGRAEVPLLECEICGQGSHNKCILDLLKAEDLTPAEAMATINPHNIPGFRYLCGPCREMTIPEKEAGMLRRKNTTSKPTGIESTTEVENNTDPEITDPKVIEATTEEKNEENVNDQSSIPPEVKENSCENKPVAPTPVCEFYKKGTCRYGASGKGCKFEHPKPCKKLMRHGNRGPHGCTLGKDKCTFFHPKMCQSSLQKGTCFNENCTLWHVSGIKRNKEAENNLNENKETIIDNTKISQDIFLEMLEGFKETILSEVENKLEKQPSQPVRTTSQTMTNQVPHQMANTNTPAHPPVPNWQVPQICHQGPTWQQMYQMPMMWNTIPTPRYQMMMGLAPGQLMPNNHFQY